MECPAIRMQRDSQNSTPTFHLKTFRIFDGVNIGS